jgi:hypothetical protein
MALFPSEQDVIVHDTCLELYPLGLIAIIARILLGEDINYEYVFATSSWHFPILIPKYSLHYFVLSPSVCTVTP